jgi:hypothetical protein
MMAYSNGAHLSPADFGPRFREAWDRAQTRFLKVERRQSYNQAGDESYEAFLRGDHESASRLLREILLKQTEMYAQARDRGVELIRVRIVEEPLSAYLRLYEIPSYFVSAELGERIVFAPPPAADDLPDLIIFDSSVMFVNTYDGLSRLAGAIEITDSAEIERHATRAEALLSESQPLVDFARDRGLDAARMARS